MTRLVGRLLSALAVLVALLVGAAGVAALAYRPNVETAEGPPGHDRARDGGAVARDGRRFRHPGQRGLCAVAGAGLDAPPARRSRPWRGLRLPHGTLHRAGEDTERPHRAVCGPNATGGIHRPSY